MSKNKGKIIFSTILSAIILYFLFREVSITRTWTVLKNINIYALFASFFLYIITTLLKSLRLKKTLRNHMNTGKAFRMMSINLMLTNILPFKTGEFSLLYMLRKHGVKYRNSIAYLVILRLIDFISIMLIFLGSMILMGFFLDTIIFLVIIAAFMFLVILLYTFIYHNQALLRIFSRITSLLKLQRLKVVKELLEKGRMVSEHITHLKSRNSLIKIFLYSITTWFVGIVNLFILIRGLGIDFGFGKTLLASSLQVILGNLPIQGLAGFGTYEGFWVLSFGLLGMSQDTAIITSVNTHIILLAKTIIVGSTAILWRKRTSKSI